MKKGTKVWLITAASLVLIGLIIFGGVMTLLKWDFTKLSTAEYENNDYEILDDYKDISITTNIADIVFVPSENQTTSVSCHEQKGSLHSVSVKDGRLEIKIEDTRKWYEHIGIGFDTPKITVYLPQSEYGKLSVKTITGRIDIRNISADSLDLTVSTGKVTVSNTDCKGDVKVEVSTGKAVLTNIRCKNALSSGETGDISLNNVIATEKLSVERSTGDVEFDGSDAAEIYIKTTTGKVTGSLLSDKVFITDTATGKVDVPKTVSGGKCEINTSTGNIKITVETE